jgi:hypothetical protein
MWYYNLNNQPTGPVDVETLRRLAETGVINAETLVWQQGMPAWQKLGVMGILAAPLTPAGAQPAYYPPQAQAYGVPGGYGQPLPRRLLPSQIKNPFITWLVFYGVSLLFSFTSAFIFSGIAATTLRYSLIGIVSTALSLTTGILLLVLLARCWGTIQDGVTGISTGKAIGFLFIPFFNFYWVFQAFHGLSREMNRFVDRHFQAQTYASQRKATPSFSLIYCILFEINLVYQVYYNIRLYSGNFFEINVMKTIAIANSVFTLLFVAAAILMMTDYYLTSRKILENMNR